MTPPLKTRQNVSKRKKNLEKMVKKTAQPVKLGKEEERVKVPCF
jgi:hypothetical protein